MYIQNLENCEAMTSSTHSFEYSYRLFKKCFVENYQNSKFYVFLIFYLIYIKFSLCSKFCTLSIVKINLNLHGISPLKILWQRVILQLVCLAFILGNYEKQERCFIKLTINPPHALFTLWHEWRHALFADWHIQYLH